MSLINARQHSLLAISLLALPLLALPASAQDANTYRAGAPYLSVGAAGSQICAAQCQGDAQCKGWNFLRSGAPDGSGMCEFNSALAGATPHPYAISGQAENGLSAGGSVVSGGTNVTRIGQPVTVVPQAQVRPQTLQASTRPVAPALQIQTRTRTFSPQAPLQVQAQRQMQAPTRPATLGGPLQAVRPNLPSTAGARTSVYQPQQRQAAIAPQQTLRPAAPQTSIPEGRPQAAAPQPASPKTYADAMAQSSSLYGSLYDDVSAPKRQAPTPPTYSEYKAPSADAPVSTKAVPIAVPAANILEVPLKDISPLAGGL